MKHRDDISETEALRLDLEQTRQHLADTVQELTHQLNVPRRLKESAAEAGSRVKANAGMASLRVKDTAGQVPALTKQHPKATAAVGGALVLGAGAAAWLVTRHK
ncbi:DUF3618 domain-containing protein [Kribbella sp. NBC_01505]|uniref:DUF3618 domain-containing protein n=1 Tax=Kribbella sp. NBC_01505 TaxID=2903580 RepID=UPI00386E3F6E